MELFPHQDACVAQVRDSFKSGNRSCLLVAPTGSGKTQMASRVLRGVAAKGRRGYIGAHREELVEQLSKALRQWGVPHGVIAAGYEEDLRYPVQVCSIPTLVKRIDRVPPPFLMAADEAHHCTLQSRWGTTMKAWRDSLWLGLTATPCRLDGVGLGDVFEDMVVGPNVRWLIENRYLSRYALFAPAERLDMRGIRKTGGDYSPSQAAGVVDKPSITGDAIATYRRVCDGVQFLTRGVSVEHSQHIAQSFRDAGVACVHLDGNTPRAERREYVRDFRNGVLRGLSNVDLFSEGFDVPGVGAVIDLRPTDSLTYAMQFWGRVLRIFAGKTLGYILDHVGNCFTHGLPDDERVWTLDGLDRGAAKERDPDDIAIRRCRHCGWVGQASATSCGDCGKPFEVRARVVEQREGELAEVDVEAMRAAARAAQANARTPEELQRLGISEGRARHIVEAREEKARLREQVFDLYAQRRALTGEPFPPRWEVMELKPKQLRLTIEALQARVREAQAVVDAEEEVA